MTSNHKSPSPDPSKIAIDLYDPLRDSLDEITDMLHRAYASLALMGFNYVAATQSAVVTKARLAAGIPYIARLDDSIIGTITYYPTAPDDISEPAYYKRSDVAHFGQFAVAPEKQKCGLGHRFIEIVEARALLEDMREIACDTAEGAIDLIDYYKRRGYRAIGYHQWSHACYRSIILAKAIGSI